MTTQASLAIRSASVTGSVRALTGTIILIAGLTAQAPAVALDEHNVVPGLTAAGAPLGLHGVDPVALIELGNRIEGSAVHAATHDGVAYYFASAANAETFRALPARYLPQNGGYCTFGVSVGKKFDGDPRYAAVENGRLYVFLNEEIYRAFMNDREGTIAKAASNWPNIRSTAAGSL